MAAALFNDFADSSKARAVSATTDPGVHVHPEVITLCGRLDRSCWCIYDEIDPEVAQQGQVLVQARSHAIRLRDFRRFVLRCSASLT